uniref:Neprosin PEP catalytic domain-containing protein n=1 Tax=Brassica oleracea var. oleracea TaxID=109376 RepID=A0A0D3DDU4_BRAOL
MLDPMKCISSFLLPDAKLAGRSKLEVPTVFMAVEVRLAIPTNRKTYISLSFGIDMNAIAYVEGDNYYGAKATINVWKPKIQQQHEFTFLQIWLLSDLFRKYLNSIEAGWKVSRIYMVTIIQSSSLTG